MDGSVSTHWDDPSIKLIMDAALTIKDGNIEVVCDVTVSTDDGDGQVYFRVLDFASSIVYSYAYAKGMGLTVILETVTKPDGILYNIREKRPELEALVTAFDSSVGLQGQHGIDVNRMLPTVFSDPLIRVALNDLVSSLIQTQYAPINCGRAIEAVRILMTPGTGDDKKRGWLAMRENLNLSQEYLEFITDQSKGPRHGYMKDIPFTAINETLKRAWVVMNRFLEFKKRGDARLPSSEFPILSN